MVTVLEHSRIAPPAGALGDKSLPLSFLDLPWIPLPPVKHLLLYEFPISKDYFIETVIPKLKHSLSITLGHFFPLAGNLVVPSTTSSKPKIRYMDGDSVSLIFAEFGADLNFLVGNHPRNAHEFYPLVPKLQQFGNVQDTPVVPLLAVQVTLFPNSGLSVGFAINHVNGDANAVMAFQKSWASITKSGGDDSLLAGGLLPFHDRSVIKDSNGLEPIYWNRLVEIRCQEPQLQCPPEDRVRGSFVIRAADAQRLKRMVFAQRPPPVFHVSTFTVTCAFIWVCMVKSRAATEEKSDDYESEHFGFSADVRTRFDPPIAATYFGNCLVPCFATAKTTQMMGEGGILVAAESIGEAIHERLHNKEGMFKGLENWLSPIDFTELRPDRIVSVAGSPRFSFYGSDFGWGKPKKSEIVTIEMECFSLNECRDSEGDLEFGFSLPKNRMDALAKIFANDLKIFLNRETI